MTVIKSSAPEMTGRQWLAIHDPRYRQHRSPRLARFQQRRHEGRRAARQAGNQRRHPPQLLRGI